MNHYLKTAPWLNDEFTPFAEEPPKTKTYNATKYDWQKRIEKVLDRPAGWYCIGVWNNKSSAHHAIGRIRRKFPKFKFKAATIAEQDPTTGEVKYTSKIYLNTIGK